MRTSPARPLAVMLATLPPTAVLARYLDDPTRNQPIAIGLVKSNANAIEVFILV